MSKFFLLVIGLILTTTACSGETEEPASTVNSESSTSVPTPDAGGYGLSDDVLIELLHEETNAFDYVPPTLLFETAESMCATLDAGRSIEEVAAIVVREFGPEGGAFIVLAAEARCPQHNSKVQGWINS